MLRINGKCSKTFNKSTVRSFTSTIPSERNWDPKAIFPSEPGQVRICGNTLRDGHQSLNGGLHRIDLLVKGAKLINDIRPVGMKFPGNEEIGGGTTIDFPLRFKGENPFRNMEQISSLLPNVPTSALIRSDSLCGYTINPRDIVRAFIKRYAECGIDIFRNFDAYNNIKNHATVAQAVIDAGKHYQAAITFTSHKDETLFNVKWAADLARAFRDLGAHSIAIKDMAGIASPWLIEAWTKEIKKAVPELPLIIHSHYTTGFAPITYIKAIEAGANGIDLSISSLSGRSGHPSMEVFTKVLSDMGYDLGYDVDEAQAQMKKVAELYREYHKHYEFCEMKMAGAMDYRVFEKGIPGGQISIFRNELIRNKMGHLFDGVIDQIQTVRDQVGGVALVTPTSEHVARQSTLNAQDDLPWTTERSRLWPGYSEMLRGVMGRPPAKQDENLQKRALNEWVCDQLKLMDIEADAKSEIEKDLSGLVDVMWTRVQPILKLQRIEDLKDRIRQLTEIDSTKYASQIKESQEEMAKLESETKDVPSDLESKYVSFLAMNPSENDKNELCSELGRSFAVNLKRGLLSIDQFYELVRAASFCTITPSEVMPDGLEKCKDEVEQLAWQHDFEIPPRNSKEFEEYAILQSMFRFAQNIALNYFRHHEDNRDHWQPNPDPVQQAKEVKDRSPPAKVEPVLYPYFTKTSGRTNYTSDFSDDEVTRLLGYEVKQLNNARTKMEDLKSYTPETEIRAKIRTRSMERTEKLISEITADITQKLDSVIENTNPSNNGVSLDRQSTLKQLQKQVGL